MNRSARPNFPKIVAIVGLLALQGWAHDAAAQLDDPGGVTLYTGPSFSGIAKSWSLPAGEAFLAVPDLGRDFSSRVASLRVGSDVAVMLFQRPHFASRDQPCGPALGSEEHPDLWWQGLSADFAPPEAGARVAFEASATAEQDYASLIVYRRSDGPPPGALLMEPRIYINRACTAPSHATYFSRIFVPARKATNGKECVNLSAPSTSPGAGTNPPKLTRTERLVIMSADMFDPIYKPKAPLISVTLFDGQDCRGESVQLRQASAGWPDFQLAELDFRHRVRSLQASVDPPDPSSLPIAGDGGEPAPLVTAAPPADVEPPSTIGDETQGTADGTGAARLEQPQPPAQESARRAPDPTPTPFVTPEAEVQPQPAAQPEPPQAPLEAVQPASGSAPAPEKIKPAVTTAALPDPPADNGKAARETFRFPVQGEYRLNYCLVLGKRCGEPAAQAWCKGRGFAQAEKWVRDANIGGLFPTIVMGDERICARYLCDGFKEITCSQ